MANKIKGKVIQMLSPENYIRKKARSLPIYECWIIDKKNSAKLDALKTLIWELDIIEEEKAVFNVII
jgi:hypothetical protein